jgi:LytS/YehU family sensor histidine kinase
MHFLQVLVIKLQVDGCYIDIRVPQHLLQPAYVNSVPHAVYGKRMPECMRINVLAYQLCIPV